MDPPKQRLFPSHDPERDKAVFLSMVWMKIVPKNYDIGTLDVSVWFRFDVAGDTSVVWAGPSSYSPTLYAGYDADEMRDRNPGLGLELLPFQDHLQNILSHIILTTKQNLPTFNSDNGCEFAGYWSVTRWGEIDDNPQYWTKEQISYGQNWYNHAYAGTYFQTIYPCNIAFPTPRSALRS